MSKKDLIKKIQELENSLEAHHRALETAHDHLLMNDKTHTRTYKNIKETLDIFPVNYSDKIKV